MRARAPNPLLSRFARSLPRGGRRSKNSPPMWVKFLRIMQLLALGRRSPDLGAELVRGPGLALGLLWQEPLDQAQQSAEFAFQRGWRRCRANDRRTPGPRAATSGCPRSYVFSLRKLAVRKKKGRRKVMRLFPRHYRSSRRRERVTMRPRIAIAGAPSVGTSAGGYRLTRANKAPVTLLRGVSANCSPGTGSRPIPRSAA